VQASITCLAKHLGCLIAQTTVRPNAVVFSPPPCGFGPSVAHRLERLALQELVSQPTVERFDEGVLPGTGRRHRDRASTHVRQPLRQRRADELRSVVAANPRRCATSADDPGQHPSHIRSGRRRADRERQALPSIFVQQRQPLECSSVDRPIRDKIVRPNIVLEPRRLVGATVGAGTRFGPQFPGFSAAKRPSQAHLDPQTPGAFQVHAPPLVNEPGVNPLIAEARVLSGQAADGTDQSRLTRAGPTPIAKRGPRSVQHVTGATLGDVIGFAEVVRGGTLLGERILPARIATSQFAKLRRQVGELAYRLNSFPHLALARATERGRQSRGGAPWYPQSLRFAFCLETP